MTMVMASCGGGDGTGDTASELEDARAAMQEVEAERDEIAAQVQELQGQLDELTNDTSSTEPKEAMPEDTVPEEVKREETVSPTMAAPTTAAPTTVAPSGEPALADASQYVAAFGDIGVVALPVGDPGIVAVVAVATALDDSSSLPVIVRNNTSAAIGQIEVTGTARDAAGTLVGSGSSQGFEPVLVGPGEIAWGYVFFGDVVGEGLTFELSTSGEEPGYFMPLEITELNVAGDQIIGALLNSTTDEVSGPLGVGGVCFAEDGSMLGTFRAYAEQDELAAGAVGSFSSRLYGDPCPIGLAGASGYGDF